MKTVAALMATAALFLCSDAAHLKSEPRQLTLSTVTPGAKNYIANMRVGLSQGNSCGGVLITKKHLLTNRGCANWPQYAVLGERTRDAFDKDGEWFQIAKKINHPKYDHFTIVELDRESKFTPVPLADRDSTYYAGTAVLSLGWSMGSGETGMYRVTQTVRTDDVCHAAKLPETINDTLFCAGGQDKNTHCVGNSGGPVVIEREGKPDLVIGTVVRNDGCSNSPVGPVPIGVHTRPYTVKKWIQEHAPAVKFE